MISWSQACSRLQDKETRCVLPSYLTSNSCKLTNILMNSIYFKAIENLSVLHKTSCDIGKVRLCYCFVYYTMNMLAYFEDPVIKLWLGPYLRIYFRTCPYPLQSSFHIISEISTESNVIFYFNLKFQMSVRFFFVLPMQQSKL